VGGVECLVAGKRAHGDAHTRWAAGGINAALGSHDPEDSWLMHAADTLREGHFVCQQRAVELLARQSPDRVRELAEWGCPFDRTPEGHLDQRYFGAQSYRRTCFVGDRTGQAILETLVEQAQARGVAFREGLFVAGLLKSGGRVVGALVRDLESGGYVALGARATVLAAGGASALYPRSSSRADENTGDATALAYGAGAGLRDMEFVQFHPTGLLQPPGQLVTEAVRGEGGQLFNAQGERFMERYSPEHMELDARDVVARAIYREILEGRGTERGGVLLDISHQDAALIRGRLPKVHAELLACGIDLTREPVEVAPTAHYTMGGIKVNFDTGATGVPGLFAVGEATSGVHGANRLGGNSLAETLVFGRITGIHLAERFPHLRPVRLDEAHIRRSLEPLQRVVDSNRSDPARLRRELGELMWRHASILRSGDGLRAGMEWLADIQDRASRSAPRDETDLGGWVDATNLRFLLVSAEAILRCAHARRESRGAHFRTDWPESSAPGLCNFLVFSSAEGAMELRREPLPGLAPQFRSALRSAHGVAYHLLE
jgi:succinate dehydrogenase / fumarate reductase, flavoprotein subunit